MGYVHGYSDREAHRLRDQADSVKNLLHHDSNFPSGSMVLEAGCGVGAQTITLAAQNPGVNITSIDISEDSLKRAQQLISSVGIANVQFEKADIFKLPYKAESFDHVFLCYVLEHLTSPEVALQSLHRVLKPGGTITVIEGDHGSCYFHPSTLEARAAWQCLIETQRKVGGNSLIGRELFPLIKGAGFHDIFVSPRMVYVDQSTPELMDSFVRKTIVPMVGGVKDTAIGGKLISPADWSKGMMDLSSVAEDPRGVFCYTFFKAFGHRV